MKTNDDVIDDKQISDHDVCSRLVEGFDEMLFLMMRFAKQQLVKEIVDDTPITPPQFGLLWCLSTSDCAQNMSEISHNMHLSQGAATGLVDRLQRLNLLDRTRSDVDRRVVSIQITDEGRQLVDRIHQRRRGILRKMLARLNDEERQLLMKIDSMMKDMLTHYED